MGEAAVQATKDGALLLTVTDGTGRPTEVKLAIEMVEKLKGQIEAALALARVRRASIRQRQIQATVHPV
jgi:hypothetical protein